MEEQNKVIEQAIKELKDADEVKLKEVIDQWFEKTRTDGFKLGAKFFAAAVMGTIKKHIKQGQKVSLRSYERCIKEIMEILSGQLTKQNDSTTENKDDGVLEDN